MAHRRSDVVEAALRILDTYGLADLTMRRLAADLEVRPSALYHHFSDKQTLLAAVADAIVERGPRVQTPAGARWDEVFVLAAHALRDTLLAFRDGAEVVATAHAFGLGSADPRAGLEAALEGLEPSVVDTAARTTLLFVLGHVQAEQLHMHAGSTGARVGRGVEGAATFRAGLEVVVAGLRAELRV